MAKSTTTRRYITSGVGASRPPARPRESARGSWRLTPGASATPARKRGGQVTSRRPRSLDDGLFLISWSVWSADPRKAPG